MTENPAEYVTEGLELLKGVPVVEFQAPSDQIVETDQGEYEVQKSLGWVKISAAFRTRMLKRLKGARLATFLCICLHVNENGEAFPGIDTIAEETGYARDTIMEALADLESIPGLLQITRHLGSKNIYRPAFAARGKDQEPTLLKPVGFLTTGGGFPGKRTTGSVKTSRGFPDYKKREESLKRESALDFKNMSQREAYHVPTLDMYKQATDFFPGSAIWEYVDKFIREHSLTEAKIHEAAVAWMSRGFKQENVSGILEWAAFGIPASKNAPAASPPSKIFRADEHPSDPEAVPPPDWVREKIKGFAKSKAVR